jgi:hypothetical protein
MSMWEVGIGFLRARCRLEQWLGYCLPRKCESPLDCHLCLLSTLPMSILKPEIELQVTGIVVRAVSR